MKIKENIAISESGFVFDAGSGDSYSLNDSAKVILSMMKEGKSDEEISKFFIEAYDVTEGTFENNFLDFKNMLQHMNLIETL